MTLQMQGSIARTRRDIDDAFVISIVVKPDDFRQKSIRLALARSGIQQQEKPFGHFSHSFQKKAPADELGIPYFAIHI
jgi:hypothetical protein